MNINQLTKLATKDKFIPLEENKNIAKSYWLMLQTESGAVEGKIHFQIKETNKLVIFEPGFPGGGSTQFEELWLEKLLQEGYAVFLARHCGTLINGKFSNGYLNCVKRQELGKRLNEEVLGSKPENSITDWLNEPLVALEKLVSQFSQVTLCGHSFGPLALIHSLIRYVKSEPSESKKINRIVSLSGSLGRFRGNDHPFLKVWYDHLNTEWARERVQIGDAKLNTDIFNEAHTFVNKNASQIPGHIEFIATVPWGDTLETSDEIVHPIESLDFITSLGRGYLIVDKKEYGDSKTGRMAHDMESLSDNNVFRFVSEKWLPESQITVLK